MKPIKSAVAAMLDAYGEHRVPKEWKPRPYQISLRGRTVRLVVDRGDPIVIEGDPAAWLLLAGDQRERARYRAG